MKILHVLAQQPGRTGSGVFLNSLLTHAAGNKQALIAGVPKDRQISHPNLNQKNIFPVYFETPQLPFPVVGMSDQMPYNSTRYSDLDDEMLARWKSAFLEQLYIAMEKFKPDIVLCHHLWLLTSLCKQTYPKLPMLAFCHGTGLRQLNKLTNYRQFVVHGCQKLERIFALSHFQKEQIILHYQYPSDKIVVLGSGYNSDLFYPPLKQRKGKTTKLVYCGKLAAAKGVFSLLQAFQKLDKNLFELHLVGSGTGQEANQIRQIAKSTKNVYLHGVVSQKKLGDIFRCCDIFVLPSFYEGLSLVILEAMACGLPVVVSRLPGLQEWLGKNLCNSDNIKFVPLPRLENVDKPVAADLPEYENNLAKAIKEVANIQLSSHFTDFIQDKSWHNIYQKAEMVMKAVLEKSEKHL